MHACKLTCADAWPMSNIRERMFWIRKAFLFCIFPRIDKMRQALLCDFSLLWLGIAPCIISTRIGQIFRKYWYATNQSKQMMVSALLSPTALAKYLPAALHSALKDGCKALTTATVAPAFWRIVFKAFGKWPRARHFIAFLSWRCGL